MPRVPNTLEDVFEGEHVGPLIEAVEAAIEQAREAGEYLQVECRLEPRGGRSRQTQCLDIDPEAPSPPIPEAIVQELYRHYLGIAEDGFRGTLRLNFRQRGNSQVVYESFQRSVVIPSQEDEEEFYGGGGGLDAPHLDLTLEDPDEQYLSGAPRGVLSAGRVGGLSPKHADYMFLPLYQETIATAERRTDALLRTFVESQTALVEMHRSATESNTTIIERLLERLPRGSLQIGEEPESTERAIRGSLTGWALCSLARSRSRWSEERRRPSRWASLRRPSSTAHLSPRRSTTAGGRLPLSVSPRCISRSGGTKMALRWRTLLQSRCPALGGEGSISFRRSGG